MAKAETKLKQKTVVEYELRKKMKDGSIQVEKKRVVK